MRRGAVADDGSRKGEGRDWVELFHVAVGIQFPENAEPLRTTQAGACQSESAAYNFMRKAVDFFFEELK
jgi:hypothetical protein